MKYGTTADDASDRGPEVVRDATVSLDKIESSFRVEGKRFALHRWVQEAKRVARVDDLRPKLNST